MLTHVCEKNYLTLVHGRDIQDCKDRFKKYSIQVGIPFSFRVCARACMRVCMQHNSEGGVTKKGLYLIAVKMCLINHQVLRSTLSSHCAHWLCFIFVAPLLFVDLCVCLCVLLKRGTVLGTKSRGFFMGGAHSDHCSERVYSQVISEQRI